MSTKDCFGHLHLYQFCKQSLAGITGKWCDCKLVSRSWHYVSLAQLTSQKLCPGKSHWSAYWVSLPHFMCWPLVRVVGGEGMGKATSVDVSPPHPLSRLTSCCWTWKFLPFCWTPWNTYKHPYMFAQNSARGYSKEENGKKKHWKDFWFPACRTLQLRTVWEGE